jgi:stage V sporulation protein AC
VNFQKVRYQSAKTGDALGKALQKRRGTMLEMSKKTYRRFADAHAPHSPLIKDCIRAFLVGGGICAFGQLLKTVYASSPQVSEQTAGTLTSITLIGIAALLTGLGVFDNIARFAGAGTLVPITGFSNSIASVAIDIRAEGYVLGVGAKIFTIAGPVLLYGTAAGTLWGVIFWTLARFG